MAAVESTIGCKGLHCSVLVEFTEFFHYQPTKINNHQKEVEFMYFSAQKVYFHVFSFENEKTFQNQQVSQKKDSELLHLVQTYSQRVLSTNFF